MPKALVWSCLEKWLVLHYSMHVGKLPLLLLLGIFFYLFIILFYLLILCWKAWTFRSCEDVTEVWSRPRTSNNNRYTLFRSFFISCLIFCIFLPFYFLPIFPLFIFLNIFCNFFCFLGNRTTPLVIAAKHGSFILIFLRIYALFLYFLLLIFIGNRAIFSRFIFFFFNFIFAYFYFKNLIINNNIF